MDEAVFHKRVDHALRDLFRILSEAGEEYGFESDLQNGALTVEFDHPPGKFVVSPNSPVRQIWVSANVKSYKLDWDEVEQGFVLSSAGQTLRDLMAEAISKHLHKDVEL